VYVLSSKAAESLAHRISEIAPELTIRGDELKELGAQLPSVT